MSKITSESNIFHLTLKSIVPMCSFTINTAINEFCFTCVQSAQPFWRQQSVFKTRQKLIFAAMVKELVDSYRRV